MKFLTQKNILKNKKFSYLVGALMILFISIGAVYAGLMEEAKSTELREYVRNFMSVYSIEGVDKSQVSLSSLYGNIKILIMIFISGLSIYLLPLGGIFILAKCFRLGFTSAFIFRALGVKGILYLFLSVFPVNIIFLPLLAVYYSFCMENAGKTSLLRNDTKFRMKIVVAFFVACLVGTVCSFLDGYVIPYFLKTMIMI